jgi:hypothetical protein
MATKANMYGNGLKALLSKDLTNAQVDWENTDIYVALVKDGWYPNRNSIDDNYSDGFHSAINFKHLQDNSLEVSGTGYTAGGALMTGRSVSLVADDVGVENGHVHLIGDDVTWTAMSLTAGNAFKDAVIYAKYSNGSGGYHTPILGYVRWDSTIQPDNQDFTIEFPTHIVGAVYLADPQS